MKEENDILYKHIGFDQSILSSNFTDQVMSKVNAISEKKVVIKPLISKKGWITIGIIASLILIISIILEKKSAHLNLFSNISWVKINIQDFKISIKLFISIISIFLIMTLIDIFYRRAKQIN